MLQMTWVVCCVLDGQIPAEPFVDTALINEVYTTRRRQVRIENEASGKAVDSLLNYETVRADTHAIVYRTYCA